MSEITDFDREVSKVVYKGSVWELRELVKTDPREEGEKYQHALEITAMNNYAERAKILLEAGAHISHDAVEWAKNNKSVEVLGIMMIHLAKFIGVLQEAKND